MKSRRNKITACCLFSTILILLGSCKKLTTVNENPNSITSSSSSPDYIMAGVLTGTATWYGDLGSGDISGAMQQTYQDAFGSTFSDYEWDPGDFDWTSTYSRLTNNKLLLSEAQANKWDFHQGVALVMRAFNYGNIADFWGDAPDSMAISGDQGGVYDFPTFDTQESIYERVIADLKAALPFFNGTMADHPEITATTQSSDVFYAGNPVEWRRFTYSLLLRYYLRLSTKLNEQANVESVADSVFQSTADDCMMAFPGVDAGSSYQFAQVYTSASEFQRNKMCGTMTMTLKALQDPRIVIMAQPIVTPTVVSAAPFVGGDTSLTLLQNGVRYINPTTAANDNYKQFDPATYTQDRPWGAVASLTKNLYDTSSVYVGIPISYSGYPDFQYNLNLSGQQSTSLNNYVSYLREDIYDQPNGPLLNQRMASYAEICFDLAEAAYYGWNVGGSASSWYYAGIQASFDTWQVFSTYQSDVNGYYGCVKDYNDYIAQPAVAYNGTLAQIMQQKWIAAWQACNEAFMDWRRTGLPALTIGWASLRQEIPVRFTYANSELEENATNAQAAISRLETTPYIGTDGANSSWSKPWLLQGTSQPW
jgi:hypothetical protein